MRSRHQEHLPIYGGFVPAAGGATCGATCVTGLAAFLELEPLAEPAA
jgi:hypothetical protein